MTMTAMPAVRASILLPWPKPQEISVAAINANHKTVMRRALMSLLLTKQVKQCKKGDPEQINQVPESGTALDVPDFDVGELAVGSIVGHEGEHTHADQHVQEVDSREHIIINEKIIRIDHDAGADFLRVLGELDDGE